MSFTPFALALMDQKGWQSTEILQLQFHPTKHHHHLDLFRTSIHHRFTGPLPSGAFVKLFVSLVFICSFVCPDHILSSIPSLIPFPADTADGFCFVTFFFKSVSIWLHHPTLHSSISCLTPFPADPASSQNLFLLHSFLSSVCPDHLTAAYVVWPPSLRMLLAPSGPRSARKSFFSQPESPENPEKWPLSSFPTFIDLKRVLCDRQK